jgi:hypothetical protein
VDRALNREDIADALGTHPAGVLPTAAELVDLIAQVEIGAFMRRFEISEELLLTAWYLHGVASAADAAVRYTPERQRRAFAVSAHIFDLALADPGREPRDRLTLCFGAQVGYRRAGLDPNATAVYRRVVDLLDATAGPVQSLDVLALQVGVAFLGLDVGRLRPLLTTWRRQMSALAATVGFPSVTGTVYGPAQAVITAVSSLSTYLQDGDVGQLETARTVLATVLDASAGTGDFDARWVAAHLLPIADGMSAASIWAVLPPDIPAAVAQAFTYGGSPVLTLWPPQVGLIRRGEHNPLDPATSRLPLSVPTSAGKTLLAQIIICAHLASGAGDVCFVTPLRSLGREVRQSLSKRLRILDRQLGLDLPDYVDTQSGLFGGLDVPAARGDVEVVTPERLMQMLRNDPQQVLDRFTLFVVDEAQLLAQRGRGFTLEGLLALLANSPARLVLLSGVLGNAISLASWLDPDARTSPQTTPNPWMPGPSTPGPEASGPPTPRPGEDTAVLYTSAWRGPRQLHVLTHGEKIPGQSVFTPAATGGGAQRVTTPLRGRLLLRAAEGRVVPLVTSSDHPVGTLVQTLEADGRWSRTNADITKLTPHYRVVAATAAHLLTAGSLLMIVSQRNYTKLAAQVMAEGVPVSDRTGDLVAFLTERLGTQHPLVDCVRRGIGFHHAGLPTDVLQALEDAIRAEQLDAIVATSTLTEGVNLPVRTVVVAESRYPGQDPDSQISPAQLLNAMGRAGRAGQETEGWIVLAVPRKPTSADFNALTPSQEELEVRSSLLATKALESLAEAERLVAQSVDAVLRLPPGDASDFTQYVWLVLSTWEQLGALSFDLGLPAAIERLLALHQMPADLRARWLALARTVRGVFLATEPATRRRWALTGTSLPSAQVIDNLAARVADTVLWLHGQAVSALDEADVLTVDEVLVLLDQLGVFTELLALPEGRPNDKDAWLFKRGNTRLDVPLLDGLRRWLAGHGLEELADAIVPHSVKPPARIEQTVDAVNRTFEHYLSWTIGVLVEQANQRLVEAQAAKVLPRDLGPMIHYGVDTPSGVALLAWGIQSRVLAHRIGRYATALGLDGDALRTHLAQLHIAGWRQEFQVNAREIVDLLEFTRTPRGGLLHDMLTSRTAVAPVTLTTPAPGPADDEDDNPFVLPEGSPATDPWNTSAPWSVAGVDDAFGAPVARPARIDHDGSEATELTVVVDGETVGVIAASAHADVLDILNAGFTLACTLQQAELTMTAVGD